MPSSLSFIAALMKPAISLLLGKSFTEVRRPMFPAASPPFALLGPNPLMSDDFQKPKTACFLNAAMLHIICPL